MEQTLAIVKP
ncbi:MAG: hypothetical protein GWM98_27860, partial [Nitrospinaceae bacterium]|nr:hypothetical protein [Nitrospinaceae bacterium]NIR57575.1 hypothetical protein [Nitrospinaceae bacterium]NIS88045.1 hypothetical protein [Nitrospinaceae bacterium]NIT84909.1 hypothetical protein [Nitrospinaceae bacterium]NIU47085.1 hypothetical protein [Nitrospinaceae bacterium]